MTEDRKLSFAKAYERLCRQHKMFIQHDADYLGYFARSLNEIDKASFKVQLQELREN